jgi:putative phosphoribosyl transferase
VAAAELGERVAAVVSRGGRPDLAGVRALATVSAATLLIVGGNDDVVLGLNRTADSHLTCDRRLAIVPGASHLFEEPGALEQVAALASEWFVEYLVVRFAR